MRGALILNEARKLVIRIKRIYDASSRNDGYRVLVDRLWPRGMNKEKAGIDIWLKEVAPSDELRKWFNHESQKWGDFKKRYFAELEHKQEILNLSLTSMKRRDPSLYRKRPAVQ